jgi:hypothetical protein
MRKLSCEFSKISCEATELIQVIGSSRGGPTKSLIAHAAELLGWKHSRAHHVWYQNARTIKAEEMDRLREVADREAARKAVADLVALRRSLAETDAERNGETIGHLDRALCSLGAEVRAVDD